MRRMAWDPDQLRPLREQAGLTQRDLGQVIGVSPLAVGLWERGEREPTPTHRAALAEALEVPIRFFNNPSPVPTLAELRRAAGLTQRIAAPRLDMGPSYLGKIEQGHYPPTRPLGRWGDLYGVSAALVAAAAERTRRY